MRLIDADKLQEDLEKVKKESATFVDILHIIEFQSVVDKQPTAFDVEKVVEQLEHLEPFHADGYGDVMVNCDDVIEIVKRS